MIIQKAKEFAKLKHKGHKDDNGENYFDAHCLVVFKILELLDVDDALLCAGLLHDTIEDTDTTFEELVKEFNLGIANLVMEVSHEGQKDAVGYYFPRLETERGIILKFADRISNLSRMEMWDKKRREHYLKKSKFWKSSSLGR